MSWLFVYLLPLSGPVVGVLSGAVAMLVRGTLGYRRTAGYLRFLLSKGLSRDPNDLGSGGLLLAEFAFFAGLGLVFLVSFFAVGFTVGFPSFFGALSYSRAAVRALTLFCIAFGVTTGLVVLFFSEPDDRAAYLDIPSILGLLVGTVTFGVAARAALLMFMYPDTHHELTSRAATRLPFGWLLDVLPFPWLATVALVLFVVAWIPRRLDTALRPWHALLLVGVVGYSLYPVVLWLSVAGPVGLLWASVWTLLLRFQSLAAFAILLAGIEYNVEAWSDPAV